MNTLFIASLLISLLFINSGYEKIFNINGTAELLKSKVNLDLPFFLYTFAIVIVVLLELVGPSLILYSSLTNKNKLYAYYSVLGLIGFTILASLLFHLNPFEKHKVNLLKNLSVIGGLLLLLDKFNN
jgi:uncharacterized membrane protein YphA (DoxX/SURF4 family)